MTNEGINQACPCTVNCPHRGNCEECYFHHAVYEDTPVACQRADTSQARQKNLGGFKQEIDGCSYSSRDINDSRMKRIDGRSFF